MLFSYKFHNLTLLISYDSITVFPNPQSTDQHLYCKINALQHELDLAKYHFDHYIKHDDDDHPLHHSNLLDDFELTTQHYHCKFTVPLTEDIILDLLNTLKGHNLINLGELIGCFMSLDNHYTAALSHLTTTLSTAQDSLADTKTIISFIEHCPNNDELYRVHSALLGTQYNYLRTATQADAKTWQGTDANNQLAITSENWAMIEKAISLQLAHNIQTQCANFSHSLGDEYAHEFQAAHTFFAIKRTRKAGIDPKAISSTYKALEQADADTLDMKYEKLFKKYR